MYEWFVALSLAGRDFIALSLVMKWASVSVSAASRGDILGDLILYFQILALEYVYLISTI